MNVKAKKIFRHSVFALFYITTLTYYLTCPPLSSLLFSLGMSVEIPNIDILFPFLNHPHIIDFGNVFLMGILWLLMIIVFIDYGANMLNKETYSYIFAPIFNSLKAYDTTSHGILIILHMILYFTSILIRISWAVMILTSFFSGISYYIIFSILIHVPTIILSARIVWSKV